MWVRKRIDITWPDIALGGINCWIPRDRGAIAREIEQCWSSSGDALVCLSVRSGFDLLLSTLQLPANSEVLVTAANIADMARIIAHHGLVPVPVDLDVNRMAPTVEMLQRAITPATRAMLVAHLFGSRIPLQPIVDLAKQRGLLFFEDCAQLFDGGDYRGHPQSDVVMFSFGSVKTATALGGGILQVRDRELLDRMRSKQQDYPVQGRWAYGLRLLKYAILAGGSSRLVFGAAVRVCRVLGVNYNRLISNAARGFRGPDFFSRIRRQPSAPLLALLRRRLRTLDAGHLARRVAKGKFLAELLREHVECPAAEVDPHSYWAFPIVVDDPTRVMATLEQAGFDSTQGHNLTAGTPPADRPELDPSASRDVLSRMIYLPCYPEMPDRTLRQMARVVLQECDHRDGKSTEPEGSPSSEQDGSIVGRRAGGH